MQASNDNTGPTTTPVLISINDVCGLTSLSRTAINNLRRDGKFPSEVMLGEKRIAFVLAEVCAWIQARIESRPRKAA